MQLPSRVPNADSNGIIWLSERTRKTASTIHPLLQKHLRQFIRKRGNPFAAVVVAEVKTGKILAMVQGKELGVGSVHTALFPEFPAASLFKIVTSAAYLELSGLDPEFPIGFKGGCAKVHPDSIWLQDSNRRKFTLKRAYALSCNSYYANIAVNHLGLGIIGSFASRLKFGATVPADFFIPPSPITPPAPENSSTHTIGQYAAGFGRVGISALHATWLHLVIANGGKMKQLQIKKSTSPPIPAVPLLSAETSAKLLDIMHGTVNGGTASYAFRPRKYRGLRRAVGGKTGTLYSRALGGTTTWFTGLMPITDPQIVVSAVVVIPHAWIIKGPNLAAEAFWAYKHVLKRKT